MEVVIGSNGHYMPLICCICGKDNKVDDYVFTEETCGGCSKEFNRRLGNEKFS